ncbi:ESCRT-II complex, vps25 subunit [Cystobasidium minutum MCA 4210]|uniref:ESCRT-II complex, vps25 subunit n=1 Tax=Cystobasidium minutum MCA 4210 TaxID=1397322 RepID=UPI0034CDBFD3|eukprot:jgi/Rhomi1/162853/estExt_Genewise1Plus.C_6_t10467
MQTAGSQSASIDTGRLNADHGHNAQGSAASLSLKPVTSPTGFVFPPIYSFPAFFTRQPAATTFASQIRQWHVLILAYCRHHRIFRIDLSEASLMQGGAPETSALWENTQVKRRARPEFILELVHLLVKAGSALYDPPLSSSKLASSTPPQLPTGTGVYILWRSIEEWSQVIYNWIDSTGQTNSIMTFYELSESGPGKDFADLPVGLLKMALQPLVKQNKAQIFQTGDGEGVKFV